MSLKPGLRGILRLSDTFEAPQWREALVFRIEGSWIKTLVRCSSAEVTASGLTSLAHNEITCCMVEAEAKHLQLGTTEEFMKLGADPRSLLEMGRNALESGDEDIQFASAAEVAPLQTSSTKKKKQRSSQTSSSSNSSGGADDPLEDFRKNWLGSGIGIDKPRKKETKPAKEKRSSRFSLIEKKKEKVESEEEEVQATRAMLRAAASSADPLHGLLALQISQNLKAKKSGGRGRKLRSRSSSRTRSSSASSSSDREARRGERGHAKAVRGYREEGRKKFRRPLRYVRKYVKELEEEMGAQDRPFKITDRNRKIHFGKQQDLKRAHYLVGAILEQMLKEDYHRAALQCVLVLQSMHQTALDSSWEVAWLITHLPDLFRPRVFGGDPDSLEHVTSYLKSVSELAKNTDQLRRKGNSKGDQEESQQKEGSKGKGRGNGGKKDAKDKEKQQSAEN